MKKIETLIDDIYALFENKIKIEKDHAIEFGKQLGEMLVSRLSEERGRPTLRLSNLGTACRRKLWYSIRAPQLAEPLSAPTRIKFLFGDITELFVVFLAKLAGHTVADEQRTVSILDVDGHIDGTIDGELVDVKSASPYSFDKFKLGLSKDNDAFGYLTQLGSYRTAMGHKRAHFIPVNKVTGHLHLDTHEEDKVDYEQLVRDAQQVLASNDVPERGFTDVPDGKSGNRKLCVNCSYCDYKTTCWPGLRLFLYAGRPTFLTRVAREPKVAEV